MRCQSALDLHNYRTNPTILYRLVSQTTARHTLTQCGFVIFGSIAPQQNGCVGAYRVIDLEQFPVRISTDKAPTPLTKFAICSFFFFCHSFFFFFFFFLFYFFFSFFLYRLVRFMAFQSVLAGTTPAFTIIINSTKRYLLGRCSLIRSHCALQHSPIFSTLIEKNIKDNVLKN